jgi:hypothetical protein
MVFDAKPIQPGRERGPVGVCATVHIGRRGDVNRDHPIALDATSLYECVEERAAVFAAREGDRNAVTVLKQPVLPMALVEFLEQVKELYTALVGFWSHGCSLPGDPRVVCVGTILP